jgi:hypothetical protein
MQQGSPKRNLESKAALESNQKLAILEFARISKSQVFPSLIAVVTFEIKSADISRFFDRIIFFLIQKPPVHGFSAVALGVVFFEH